MTRLSLAVSRESLEVLAQLNEQFSTTSHSSRIRDALEQSRINKLMNSDKPLDILTKGGLVRNYASNIEALNIERLRDWIVHNRITESLKLDLVTRQTSTDAHRRVIADLQKSLDEANIEIGKIDPITRNRKAFGRLLQETFSVKLGFVSVNIQKFGQLIRFIYQRPKRNS